MKIGFIGAGGVNFGGVDPGAPWDHASRLEKISESLPLEIIGIADPFLERAQLVLTERVQKGSPIWARTKLYQDYRKMLDLVDVVFIGVPPSVHGDIEIHCADAGVHMFIEKPLHCKEPREVKRILQAIKRTDVIVSVGYMLRYSKGVQFIRDFLRENQVRVVAVNARYNSAYTAIPKPFWWDSRKSGGPIIEQGTHFLDLCRYFGGEVDFDSVQAVSVSPLDEIGQLSEIPEGCDVDIPDQFRIPRSTQAVWQFKNGAIGTLHHGLLMKGESYHTELELWCDGYRIVLSDPYSSNCTVTINEEISHFVDDDPYLTEDIVFLNAVLTGETSKVQSPYEDSAQTYELSYIIANKSVVVKPKL